MYRLLAKKYRRTVAITAIVILVLSGDLAAASYAQNAPTTVVLVRHAEKAVPGDPGYSAAEANDPPLTTAGVERAAALSHLLTEAGVTAIYSSPFRRTRQTVLPLAQALGLTVIEHPAADTAGLAAKVRVEQTGGLVVISGHSNTVPVLVEALGAGSVDPIEEAWEYDNLYLVIIDALGRARVTTLKYGAPSVGGSMP